MALQPVLERFVRFPVLWTTYEAAETPVASMLAMNVPSGNRFTNRFLGLILARMKRIRAPGGPRSRANVMSSRQLSGPTKYATSAPA
ncbi:hypothetical protein QFC19_005011 [Naganishia cerealis]|uniref:Uncharacterized protein n=1 Tax=Naganishia cerealis TaxID=610337 RepID=A0ACC2VSA1_9TREE|nr:hypothetical protein QFC19_005011 [Naganishia cerealis]